MGKSKFIIGGLLIVGAIALLSLQAFQTSATYYLTVEELVAKGSEVYGQNIRLAAVVDKSTVERDAKNLILKFDAIEGSHVVPVVYTGVVPDTFDMSESIVVEGKYTPEGVLEAHTLFVQCPSKYEAELKDTGG